MLSVLKRLCRSRDDWDAPDPTRIRNSGASGSSSEATRDTIFNSPPKKLNDEVYEIQPAPENPNVEIIFFHGFEITGDCTDAYWKDWLSRDGDHCWLETWLVEEIPRARILSVSYRSSLTQNPSQQRMDLNDVARNLVLSLIRLTNVARRECPVVLVGHSLGGLVMKKLMEIADCDISKSGDDVLLNFFNRVRGLFFYATPHTGSRFVDTMRDTARGSHLGNLEIFWRGADSLHEDFMNLRSIFKWTLAGVGELQKTKVGEKFYGMVVEQASASQGMTPYLMVDADHVNVCKPNAKTCSGFQFLSFFIKDIIKKDSESGQQCYGLPDYPVDLEDRAKLLEKKLQSMEGGMVGIIGMGGVGKTTLARKLFNNISRNFEYTCFIDNVKGVQIHELKDWIFGQCYQNGFKVGGKGGKLTWEIVMSKSVLIVMDDVDSVDQLKVLPSKLRDFKSGRIIIFTSRKKLDQRYKCIEYVEVDFLKEDDARRLFCQHAFESDDIPERLKLGLEANVQEVMKMCGGLPLSLQVLGSCLYGYDGDLKRWEDIIGKVRRAQPLDGQNKDRLFWPLQLSYEALAPEETQMFDDVANRFFEDRLDVALAAWSTSFSNPAVTWENLVRRCLVKEVTRQDDLGSRCGSDFLNEVMDEYKEIWMHEHLRDLGRKLAKTSVIEVSEADANKVISIPNSIVVEGETKQLRSLLCRGSIFDVVQLSSLAKLTELKYVSMRYVCLQQDSSEDFPREVALLQWSSGNLLADFPTSSLHGMGNLAVLELDSWRFSEELMEDLGNHINLQVLTLKSIFDYHLPESIGRLRQLRRLIIGRLVVGLPQAFGNLSSLEHLELEGPLPHLPVSFGSLSHLKTLCLLECDFIELPESFGSLRRLVTLIFKGCEKLTHLPESFVFLPCLATLFFQGCNLKTLPDSFGFLPSLVSLSFVNCPLTHLPYSFGFPPSLVSLSFDSCEFTHLADIGSLSSLEYLSFALCNELKVLPNSLGTNFPSLQKLSINLCSELKQLPPTFSYLSGLRELDLLYNPLENLREAFGNSSMLQHLRVLHLYVRNTNLPPGFSHLSSKALESLDLTLIEEVPNPFFSGEQRHTGYRDMSDSNGSVLESCWDLSTLEHLTTQGKELTALGKRLGERLVGDKLCLWFMQEKACNLGSNQSLLLLKSMELVRGDGVESFPESIGQLTLLQNLKIAGRHLKRLPDSLQQVCALTQLVISRCQELETIPESLGNLFSLQHVTLIDCGRLETVPQKWRKAGFDISISGCPLLRRD